MIITFAKYAKTTVKHAIQMVNAHLAMTDIILNQLANAFHVVAVYTVKHA